MLGAPSTGILCLSTLWFSIKRIFLEYWTPAGQRGQQYPQLVVRELWLRGELLPHGDPRSSCTQGFAIKQIFPEYWPGGLDTHPIILQYTHGPVPEVCLAVPWCTAAGGTQHRSPVPIYPLGLDKTNFPRILNPHGAKGATIPTTRSRSPGSELRLTTWRPPSSYTPGFSIKRIFPKFWPAGPGTHRNLLEYPHGPVPERCLTLPCCTAARGTQHRSPVPTYPLWLDKTNSPWILIPTGQRGKQFPQLALSPVRELWLRGRLTWG